MDYVYRCPAFFQEINHCEFPKVQTCPWSVPKEVVTTSGSVWNSYHGYFHSLPQFFIKIPCFASFINKPIISIIFTVFFFSCKNVYKLSAILGYEISGKIINIDRLYLTSNHWKSITKALMTDMRKHSQVLATEHKHRGVFYSWILLCDSSFLTFNL